MKEIGVPNNHTMFINKPIKAGASWSTIQPQNNCILGWVSFWFNKVVVQILLFSYVHVSATFRFSPSNHIFSTPNIFLEHMFWLQTWFSPFERQRDREREDRDLLCVTLSSVWRGRRHWNLVLEWRDIHLELLERMQNWEACKMMMKWQKAAYPCRQPQPKLLL